jgi:hypothetical protein
VRPGLPCKGFDAGRRSFRLQHCAATGDRRMNPTGLFNASA